MSHTAGSTGDADPSVDFVLDRLSVAVRGRLALLARTADFAKDEVVLREGQDTPFLAVVERGRVALRMRVPELGERLTIVTVEAGELLGWSAVVAPYRATIDAIATQPTRLITFEASELRRHLADECDLAAELLPLVLDSVSRRLTASWTQLLDVFGRRVDVPW